MNSLLLLITRIHSLLCVALYLAEDSPSKILLCGCVLWVRSFSQMYEGEVAKLFCTGVIRGYSMVLK